MLPVLEQKKQQIEHFGPNRDQFSVALELAPVGVQAVVSNENCTFSALVGRESKENSIAIQDGCKAFQPASAQSHRAFTGKAAFRNKRRGGQENRGKS
jgi:hypothetical protein